MRHLVKFNENENISAILYGDKYLRDMRHADYIMLRYADSGEVKSYHIEDTAELVGQKYTMLNYNEGICINITYSDTFEGSKTELCLEIVKRLSKKFEKVYMFSTEFIVIELV